MKAFKVNEIRWNIYAFLPIEVEEQKKMFNPVVKQLTRYFLDKEKFRSTLIGARKVCYDMYGKCSNCYHYGIYDIYGVCMNHHGEKPDCWMSYAEFSNNREDPHKYSASYEEYKKERDEAELVRLEEEEEYIRQCGIRISEYFSNMHIPM